MRGTLTNIVKVTCILFGKNYRINWKNTIKPLMNLKFNANIAKPNHTH